jgi:glycosyltransferase involved in cell wall biosynthesis
MAAGLPVVAARAGGLAEAVPEEGLYPPGDAAALAERLRALWGSEAAGERALATVRERFSPEAVAGRLAAVYATSAAESG